MDPADFIHIYTHSSSHVLNKEEIGRKEFGKEWREDKEGGK